MLLTNRTVPAMFLLLLFGAVCGIIQSPAVLHAVSGVRLELHAPHFALARISWHDLWAGTLFLALPQLPLTLGNAVIAIREENNRLFPAHPVSDRSVATSTGLMNLAGSCVGGVPMCHGAGGMAGHVAFGARTGGAPIILGTILLVLAFGFSGSIETILTMFPKAVLGVILFLTGAQLALGSCDFSKNKVERFITLATAAFAIWNVGLAFVVGIALGYMAKRAWLRL
jgi:MFS superfamily sulfate permease-like transporter